MTLEAFRSYCLTKRGVTEEFPFDERTLVFKVMGKMFALTDTIEFEGINLKAEPEKGVELRERYSFVHPAYHMNKKHWVTVAVGEGATDQMIRQWTDDSYLLVVAGLTKSQRLALGSL